jgi:hypothetical protein
VKFHTRFKFLDGEFARLAMAADSLVDSPISSTADESDHLVPVNNADFALIAHILWDTPINWVWANISYGYTNEQD